MESGDCALLKKLQALRLHSNWCVTCGVVSIYIVCVCVYVCVCVCVCA